jgi:hypothetical protein
MKKLMTYGFYALLLAVFAVNVNVLSFDSGNQDSSTIELTDSFISSPEAVASGSDCPPDWQKYYEVYLNDRFLFGDCNDTGCSCTPDVIFP